MIKKYILFFACLYACFLGVSSAQTTVPMPFVKPQFFNTDGTPCAGCTLSTFAAGTSTPLATFTDSTGSTPNGVIITLDAAGRADVWLSAASYKLVLKDAGGVQIWSEDNVSGANLATVLNSLTVNGNLTQGQPTAATAGANQSSFLDCEQGKYWTGAASAIDQWCLADILGSGTNPTSTWTLTHSGSSGAASVSLPVNVSVGGIDNRFYVDGTKYALTQAGVQSALNDACAFSSGNGVNGGGTVYLAPAAIILNTQAGQLLQSNCPLHIQGVGGQGTILLVTGGISSSIPVFRLKRGAVAGASSLFYTIENIQVQCNTGCPTAGDVFLLDNGNTSLTGPQGIVLKHVSINPGSFNGFDFNQTGNSPGDFLNHLEDNWFQSGGVKFTATEADSQLTEHNLFRGTGSNPCMDITNTLGASHNTVVFNNMQCNGGAIIVHGNTQPKIAMNQIEASSSCTEANSSLIDLVGDTSAIVGADIFGNNLNTHTTCTNNIRFGANSTNWRVSGNAITVNNTAGVGINIVAGSTGGIIGPNLVTLGGTASFVSGDTAAARVTLYGNTGVGEPGTRSIAPSDTDSAIVARANSGTQSASVLKVEDSSAATQFAISKAGLPTTLGGLATVANGTPIIVAKSDVTGLTANTGPTTIYAVPASGAGMYRVAAYLVETANAGVTSSLPQMNLLWTDSDTSAANNLTIIPQTAGSTGNTIGTTNSIAAGPAENGIINVKSSTNIQFQTFGYASNPATTMQYAIHIKLEYLGN